MALKISRYILVMGIFAFASCKLDPCKDFRCVNGKPLQDYKECVCWCNDGWEGIDCTHEDKCVTNHVDCKNGGYCNGNGVCVCNEAYEGDSCQFYSRNRYLLYGEAPSYWTAKDTCDTTYYDYEIKIMPNSANSRIEIYNIREAGTDLFIVANANKLNCDQRNTATLGDVQIRNFFGTITTDSTRLSVTYTAEQNDSSSNCSGRWLRK